MRRVTAGILAFCCVASVLTPASVVASPSPQLRAWVRERAVLLRVARADEADSGLRVLDELIAPGTRVIGFGEPVHGAHEPLAMRNRLFAYLVEHHGVTAYAGETSFTSATAIDDYVARRGGELTQALCNAVHIAAPGDPQSRKAPSPGDENCMLIEWMRAYNQRPGTQRPLRFYGIDICSRSGNGRGPCMRAALEAALDYLSRVDSVAARNFGRRLVPYLPYYDHHDQETPPEVHGKAFGAAERDGFTAALADLVDLFSEQRVFWVAHSSPLGYRRAFRNAVVARKLDAWVRMNREAPAPDDIWAYDVTEGSEVRRRKGARDSAMAENVRWALEQEGAGRIFLFAHDSHLDKGNPMMTGAHLQESLGAGYRVIGSIGVPTPEARAEGMGGTYDLTAVRSLTMLLESTGPPPYFLDVDMMPALETLPQDRQRTQFRAHITAAWRVQTSYDALIFLGPLRLMGRSGESSL